MKASLVLKEMLARYELKSIQDYTNALKEIIQEVALLGLWRAKFFEKAAFYGGTALRILYQLDRFSEDLDFTLLKKDKDFDLSIYEKSITEELESLGFSASVKKKLKTQKSAIDSAFIKINTLEHLLIIGLPSDLNLRTHRDEILKVRLEVDTDPPPYTLKTENRLLLLPLPFHVKTLRLEDLFAGKIAAALSREWQGRVKGRDWYDLIWFIARKVKVNLSHLEKRMVQTGHWKKGKKLDINELKKLFQKKIAQLDIQSAKKDMISFIPRIDDLTIWSKSFFEEICSKIEADDSN